MPESPSRMAALEEEVRRMKGELHSAQKKIDHLQADKMKLTADILAKETLPENEERLRIFFEHIPSSLAMFDLEMRYLYVSRRWRSDYGLGDKEILGESHYEIFPEIPAEWREAHRRGLSGEVLRAEGDRFERNDGSVQWVRWEIWPWHDSSGKVGGIVIFTEDITARKQAEADMAESRAKFQAIFNSISDAIVFVDQRRQIMMINPAFTAMFGYQLANLTDQTTQIIYADPDAYQNQGKQRFNPNATISQPIFENTYRRKDGSIFSGETIGTKVTSEDGELLGFIGVIRDMTSRKRTEDALRESEFFFKESQRLASIGSYKADLIAGYWSSSEVLDEIFGIGPDYDRSIQGWFARVHPDDREMMEHYLKEEVIAQRKTFDKEYRIIRDNDGETRWVSGLGALKTDADGCSLLLMGTIQDITEQKKREEAEAKLEAQLHQSQKIESVGRLAGGVAHDYNNMLSVIIGNAELAQMKAKRSAPLDDNLEHILKAANRSRDITRQLLAFARKQIINPKVSDLNVVVESMLRMLGSLLGENIDLRWQPKEGLGQVKIDPSQLDQVLANLCINARDAITENGKITIETASVSLDEDYCKDHPGFIPGNYVVLSVTDNGCGMDKETLDNIFEPFFTTKQTGEGTGLGMATVYGIVKQSGGFINVYSEPNQGTTFKIYFPRHEGEDVVSQVTAVSDIQMGKGETVLLVEDEIAIVKLATAILEDLGYRVLATNSPEEAITLAEGHPDEIQLLLTDVVMPGMNGRDLAKQISIMKPDMKVLYMSGYTANVIAHHGVLDEGINFIQKPFARGELSVRVREILDSNL